MIGITRQQLDCLNFVRSYTREHGYSPSFQEIADALRLKSKSGALRLLDNLEDRGHIVRLRRRSRSIQLVKRFAAANDEEREAKIAQHRAIIRGLKNPAPPVSGIALTGIRFLNPEPRHRARGEGDSAASSRVTSAGGGGSIHGRST